ncbi:YigZ family protein [Pseudonocardia sp. 73-21]|uniref:YigZ family protein n=1 Tax=Pseudonocardia sp. 73-21 TaxID=1895809 RepID=UPI0009604CB9|nr:YigZ family protein [Pseudonocardia sp. 73-21]OJY43789.1 MAG: YigZ family protein [Pseudonocardia sp. 73-21]
MLVIARPGTHEIEIQRSRFLCHLARVEDVDAATAFIATVRTEHWAASHNCSAFRLAGIQRSSDDGEPAGTAGVPMLEVLLRRGLTDTVAVVTRWFGGTKLGAGGLVRAYGRAVSEAVDAVGTLRRVRHETFTFATAHTDAGRLQNALHTAGFPIADIAYGRDAVFTVHVTDPDGFRRWLAGQTGGSVEAVAGDPVDLDVP